MNSGPGWGTLGNDDDDDLPKTGSCLVAIKTFHAAISQLILALLWF